ncbi:hypothetical protein [Actinoplanes sp. GCM10030250]|uniref:hypothetical protein n=1 Tax=Actinoplanes sp. GCM10030250 TaxID=3273376 RepID=UPI0036092498
MKKTPRGYRVLAALAGALLGLSALAGPAGATGHGNPGGGNHGGGGGNHPDCVSAADARWLHEFDGKAGTASIQLDKKRTHGKALCDPQWFSLVSYATTSTNAEFPQYLLAKQVLEFPADTFTTLKFEVAVPTCYMQVDFVFGDKVLPLDHKGDGELYGDRKVGSDRNEGSRSSALPGNPKHAWYNGDNGGTCAAKPEVTAQSSCNGEVTLALNNRSGNKTATFVVTGENGFTKTVTIKARELDDNAVVVPAASAGKISVTADGMTPWTGGWTEPEGCAQPEAVVKHTCDGLGFTVTNPAGGKSLTATFTPNKGEAQTATVATGETKTVTFAGQEGLTVTVTGDLKAANGTVTWAKPKDCGSASPSPSTTTPTGTPTTTPEETPSETPDAPATTTPSDEGDEELALTGAAAGTVAGGAALLLVVGAGLFLMARRRKVNFKA